MALVCGRGTDAVTRARAAAAGPRRGAAAATRAAAPGPEERRGTGRKAPQPNGKKVVRIDLRAAAAVRRSDAVREDEARGALAASADDITARVSALRKSVKATPATTEGEAEDAASRIAIQREMRQIRADLEIAQLTIRRTKLESTLAREKLRRQKMLNALIQAQATERSRVVAALSTDLEKAESRLVEKDAQLAQVFEALGESAKDRTTMRATIARLADMASEQAVKLETLQTNLDAVYKALAFAQASIVELDGTVSDQPSESAMAAVTAAMEAAIETLGGEDVRRAVVKMEVEEQQQQQLQREEMDGKREVVETTQGGGDDDGEETAGSRAKHVLDAATLSDMTIVLDPRAASRARIDEAASSNPNSAAAAFRAVVDLVEEKKVEAQDDAMFLKFATRQREWDIGPDIVEQPQQHPAVLPLEDPVATEPPQAEQQLQQHPAVLPLEDPVDTEPPQAEQQLQQHPAVLPLEDPVDTEPPQAEQQLQQHPAVLPLEDPVDTEPPQAEQVQEQPTILPLEDPVATEPPQLENSFGEEEEEDDDIFHDAVDDTTVDTVEAAEDAPPPLSTPSPTLELLEEEAVSEDVKQEEAKELQQLDDGSLFISFKVDEDRQQHEPLTASSTIHTPEEELELGQEQEQEQAASQRVVGEPADPQREGGEDDSPTMQKEEEGSSSQGDDNAPTIFSTAAYTPIPVPPSPPTPPSPSLNLPEQGQANGAERKKDAASSSPSLAHVAMKTRSHLLEVEAQLAIERDELRKMSAERARLEQLASQLEGVLTEIEGGGSHADIIRGALNEVAVETEIEATALALESGALSRLVKKEEDLFNIDSDDVSSTIDDERKRAMEAYSAAVALRRESAWVRDVRVAWANAAIRVDETLQAEVEARAMSAEAVLDEQDARALRRMTLRQSAAAAVGDNDDGVWFDYEPGRENIFQRIAGLLRRLLSALMFWKRADRR